MRRIVSLFALTAWGGEATRMRIRTLSLATLACLGLLAANGSSAQTIQETKLLASDGAEGDGFGLVSSVSGDVVVVGAQWDDDNGTDSGSAYVYRFDGANLIEEAKLIASDGAAGDHFGGASVSGDVAVVGASGDDDNGEDSGSAYVYRFDGLSWVEEAKLLASDGAEGDGFGVFSSVSGDVVVVGAQWGGDNVENCGSAYVYRFDGTNWVEEAKLVASDAADGDNFGISVSVSGDVAVVGAAFDDDRGDRSGSAYVYRFNGTSWVEEAKLIASDETAGDKFGISVSVSGDVALVGAYWDDDSGSYSGSAYVYRFDGTDWVEEAKLLASDGAAGDKFGITIGLSGDVAVVGAFCDDDNGEDSGSAYVYRFDGLSWVEEAKLLPSHGARGDWFGRVAVSGDMAVVGAHHDDDSGENSGSAHVFSHLSATPACADGVDNDGDGLADLDDPGCVLALDTSEQSSLLVCDDGLDNDGDGLIDYPADPGCQDVWGIEDPPCHDGIDNDGDGLVDFPADPGCTSPTDPAEEPECSDGLDNDGDGLIDHSADPGCADASDESEKDDAGTYPCDDSIDNDGDGLVDFPDDPGCDDPQDSSETSASLFCDDGLDNDGDGLVDFPDDPGCDDPQDSFETSAGLLCDDGLDNDGDGLIDYPADPGCQDVWGIEDPPCHDGIDNDGDGLVDFPADPGCTSPTDPAEEPFEVSAGAPDVLATDGTCSLREAIINANDDDATWPDCHAGSGADTIVLPAGNYVLAIPGAGEDAAVTGDLDIIDDLTLVGAGSAVTTIDGAGLDRVLDVSPAAALGVEGLTITGGVAPDEFFGGGGIRVFVGSLSLRNTTVSGNSACDGGGLFVLGELRAENVIVSGNTASNAFNSFWAPGGGGIALVASGAEESSTIASSTISGNQTAGNGGGVLLSANGDSELLLRESLVSDNVAEVDGGGVYNGGGTVRLLNSSVSRNLGAGVETVCTWTCGRGCICLNGNTIILNSTVSGNSGGGVANPSAHVELKASVIADQASGADCTGALSSQGHNLDSDGTCNLTDPTDLPNTDPILGALQDNGGPTHTHALLPGSPAIDAIPLASCASTEDQRGVARPQGDSCDIGAYEVNVCADGLDNDGDGLIDYPEDPGCRDATSVREDPQCQDGINNDPGQDGRIDFDGGQSIWGYCTGEPGGCPPEVSDPDGDGVANPDPQCVGTPWKNREARPSSCGLGVELAVLLPPLMWIYRRRRS